MMPGSEDDSDVVIFDALDELDGLDVDSEEEEEEDDKPFLRKQKSEPEKPEEDKRTLASFPQAVKRKLEVAFSDDKDFADSLTLQVWGLPSNSSVQSFRNLSSVLQLKANKVKTLGPGSAIGFLVFDDLGHKKRALSILNGYEWNGSVLYAKSVGPVSFDGVPDDSKVSLDEDRKLLPEVDADVSASPLEKVKQVETPLICMNYHDQLLDKEKSCLIYLRSLTSELANLNFDLAASWIPFNKARRNGQVCDLASIVPSPVTEGYRNLVVLSTGVNPETNKKCTGISIPHSNNVAPIGDFKHIPDNIKKISEQMNMFLYAFEEYEIYDQITHDGVLRGLIVRTTRNKDVMIVLHIHPQNMKESEVETLLNDFKQFFIKGGADLDVTSIYYVLNSDEILASDLRFSYLWGNEYITETVHGENFKISAESLFMTNAYTFELIYNEVFKYLNVDGTDLVIDMTCGVGEFVCLLSPHCYKLYGFESHHTTTSDAINNIGEKQLDNVFIEEGDLREAFPDLLKKIESLNTLLILTWRKGEVIDTQVFSSIRKFQNIQHIVFITDEPQDILDTLTPLLRPKSNNYKGDFFIPLRAVAVDTAPHTKKYHLVMLLERWDELKWRRIMIGNPLPKDEEFYHSIPPVSECTPLSEEIVEQSEPAKKKKKKKKKKVDVEEANPDELVHSDDMEKLAAEQGWNVQGVPSKNKPAQHDPFDINLFRRRHVDNPRQTDWRNAPEMSNSGGFRHNAPPVHMFNKTTEYQFNELRGRCSESFPGGFQLSEPVASGPQFAELFGYQLNNPASRGPCLSELGGYQPSEPREHSDLWRQRISSPDGNSRMQNYSSLGYSRRSPYVSDLSQLRRPASGPYGVRQIDHFQDRGQPMLHQSPVGDCTNQLRGDVDRWSDMHRRL